MRQNTTRFLARPQFNEISRITRLQLVSSIAAVLATLLVALFSLATFFSIRNGIVVEADLNATDIIDLLNEIRDEITTQTETLVEVKEGITELDAAFDVYATEATEFFVAAEAELLDISIASDITAGATASLDAAFFFYAAQFSDFSRDILCQNNCVGCTRLCDLSKEIVQALEEQLRDKATEATLKERATEVTLKECATEATLQTRASEETLDSRASESALLSFKNQHRDISNMTLEYLYHINGTMNVTLFPIRDTQNSILTTANKILAEIRP